MISGCRSRAWSTGFEFCPAKCSNQFGTGSGHSALRHRQQTDFRLRVAVRKRCLDWRRQRTARSDIKRSLSRRPLSNGRRHRQQTEFRLCPTVRKRCLDRSAARVGKIRLQTDFSRGPSSTGRRHRQQTVIRLWSPSGNDAERGNGRRWPARSDSKRSFFACRQPGRQIDRGQYT